MPTIKVPFPILHTFYRTSSQQLSSEIRYLPFHPHAMASLFRHTFRSVTDRLGQTIMRLDLSVTKRFIL